MLTTAYSLANALSHVVMAAYLVWLLGLGCCYHPDQGPVPVIAVGAVHQELVSGPTHPLPLSITLPVTCNEGKLKKQHEVF